MNDATRFQQEVTRLVLGTLAGTDFALAGSGAIREYGLIDRPTEDIDLFTTQTAPDVFAAAVEAVMESLRAGGLDVTVAQRVSSFARLNVAEGPDHLLQIDMGIDWRDHPPAQLAIGQVLDRDDAVGNKIAALFSRGEPRDFLDVDAIRRSGAYSDSALVELARDRDPGFDISLFIEQLRRVGRLTPEHVADYDVDREHLHAAQARLREWADELERHSPA